MPDFPENNLILPSPEIASKGESLSDPTAKSGMLSPSISPIPPTEIPSKGDIDEGMYDVPGMW